MHGEVGVNVLRENNDDVDMPDVAIHNADGNPVSTQNLWPQLIMCLGTRYLTTPRITVAFLGCYVM